MPCDPVDGVFEAGRGRGHRGQGRVGLLDQSSPTLIPTRWADQDKDRQNRRPSEPCDFQRDKRRYRISHSRSSQPRRVCVGRGEARSGARLCLPRPDWTEEMNAGAGAGADAGADAGDRVTLKRAGTTVSRWERCHLNTCADPGSMGPTSPTSFKSHLHNRILHPLLGEAPVALFGAKPQQRSGTHRPPQRWNQKKKAYGNHHEI